MGLLLVFGGLFLMRLEITSTATGIVRAQEQQVLYAPRSAQIREIPIKPGQVIQEGDILMVLQDSGLDRDILAAETEMLEIQRRIAMEQSQLAELEITGGLIEALTAEGTADLLNQRVEILSSLESILNEAFTEGATTRLRSLNAQIAALDSQIESKKNSVVLALKEAGLPKVLIERRQGELELNLSLAKVASAQMELLKEQRDQLIVRAPFDGVVADLYVRDIGMKVDAGQKLMTLADPSDGFEVRAYVTNRNVDLIRPGLPVRMESHVYQSSAEGYILGEVERIVTDPSRIAQEGDAPFEVVIRILEFPAKPVLGQGVDVKIIVRDAGPFELLFQKPLRTQDSSESSEMR